MAIVHDKLAERSASKANMSSTPTPQSKLPQRSRTPRLSTSVSGIQVPATQAPQASPLKESHTPQVDHQHHNNGDLDEESELKIAGANPEFEPGDPKAELPFFNWKEFEQRYETAIKAASDKEDDLLEEFNNLTEVSPPDVTISSIQTNRVRPFKYGQSLLQSVIMTGPGNGMCLYPCHRIHS
jgi:hypothetical protein